MIAPCCTPNRMTVLATLAKSSAPAAEKVWQTLLSITACWGCFCAVGLVGSARPDEMPSKDVRFWPRCCRRTKRSAAPMKNRVVDGPVEDHKVGTEFLALPELVFQQSHDQRIVGGRGHRHEGVIKRRQEALQIPPVLQSHQSCNVHIHCPRSSLNLS